MSLDNAHPDTGPPPVLSAADFTDAVMYAAPVPIPERGWRKVVYRGSGRLVNPGPSAVEQHRHELARRLRTPIVGSRRVVVMSRKGGVDRSVQKVVDRVRLRVHLVTPPGRADALQPGPVSGDWSCV